MTNDYTTSFSVTQNPEDVFQAINNVRGWWSETIEGETQQPGDEFIYRHKDLHYSKQKLTEVIPNEKVVWLVTESHLSFPATNKSEWTGTLVQFEIFRQGDETRLLFTHKGLVPQLECFGACSNGWHHYLHESLLPLITKGKGQPDVRENKTETEKQAV